MLGRSQPLILLATLLGLAALPSACGGTSGVRARNDAGGMGGGGGGMAMPYDCSSVFALLDCTMPTKVESSGHVVDFSPREWVGSSGKWCDASMLQGSTFAFKGSGANDSSTVAVDAAAQNLKMNFTVTSGSYVGGGVAFQTCVDASAFTGLRFNAQLTDGSLSGCSWQIQLQTQEQRPTTQGSPSGGTCDANAMTCYRFPAAMNLPTPATDQKTLISQPFSAFTTGAAQMKPAAGQIVGLQFQVNSSGGGCSVELRVDDIEFFPAVAPADAGTTTDATAS